MSDTEMQIRKMLDADAESVEVPSDLAARTIDAAREAKPRRLQAWLDAWSVSRAGSIPKWAYAMGAIVLVAGMYGAGILATNSGQQVGSDRLLSQEQPAVEAAEPQTLEAPAGDAELAQKQPAGGGSTGAQAGPVTSDVAVAPAPPSAPRPGVPSKLVRNAEVEVEVKRGTFQSAWSRANDIADKHGGFVSNSSTEQVKGRLARGNLSISVPSAKLDAAVADFGRLGTLVRSNSSSSDVGAQFVDYDARIRTLKAQETTLLELLGRARQLSDILEVRNQLNATRQEIESLQAQRKFLQDQVDFSTITASIHEPGTEPDSGEPGPLSDAWSGALRVAVTVLSGTLVVLAALAPLAVIALVAAFGMRMYRRRGT